VAWSVVCLPKSEGGLGLRRFTEWNVTLSLKLIWLLFSNSNSLWVAWHRHYWFIKKRLQDTWNWKCLIRLRPLAERFIKCYLGNGLNASFWRDNWSPFGPLIKFLGEEGPRRLRIPVVSSVSKAIVENSWILPSPRSDVELQLHTYLSTIALPLQTDSADSYGWVVQNVDCNGFSSSKTWEVLRRREDKKDWAPLIWFKGATPRNSFHMWISNLDRLPTRARLVSWGLQISPLCCLCSQSVETRDHLILTCGFSSSIWNMVQARLRLQPVQFRVWESLLSWIKLSTASSPSIIRKLVAQATVCAIWKQRNNLLHNLQDILPSIIFKNIDREIINSINARCHRRKFRSLMRLWIR